MGPPASRTSAALRAWEDTGDLDELLWDDLGVSVELEEGPHGTIDRFKYKARRWVDEREAGLERVRFVEKK